ncbi:MAG TPA: prohibitin family protein [Stellaceae bacterium]
MNKIRAHFRHVLGRIWDWIDNHLVTAAVLTVVVTIVVVVLWPLAVVFVPAGDVGVLWQRFAGGTDTEDVFPEGFHLIYPWNIMYIYNARFQLVDENYDVLTSDELRSTIDIAFRFRIDTANVGWLHKLIGPDYLNTLLVPDVGSQARTIFAQYNSEDAFTDRRRDIETLVRDAVARHLLESFNPPGQGSLYLIDLEDVLIRGVTLPAALQSAIEAKQTEFTRAQAYDYTLAAEQKEAQRKVIEAEGIRSFENIVNPGLTENYLRWSGIDATLKLAQSPNGKIVVIGSGQGGLPIILGNLDTGSAPAIPPSATVPLSPGGPAVIPAMPPLPVLPPAPALAPAPAAENPPQTNVMPPVSVPPARNPTGTAEPVGRLTPPLSPQGPANGLGSPAQPPASPAAGATPPAPAARH